MSWRGQRTESVPSIPTPSAANPSITESRSNGVAHPVDAYSDPTPSTMLSQPPPSDLSNHPPPPPHAEATHTRPQSYRPTETDRSMTQTSPLPPPPPSAQYGNHPPPPMNSNMTLYGGYGYQPGPYGPGPGQGDLAYGPGVWHDGGKILGGSKVGIGLRYGLMVTHFVLVVVTAVISGYFLRDLILLIIHCCAALAFLIYMPAAFGITIARRKNHFDHAAGELSYLVIQQCLWLGSAIYSTIYVAVTECTTRRRVYNASTRTYLWIPIYDRLCRYVTAIAGLSYAHFLILLGWMIWVIVLVYRASPGDPSRGFQVSTAWLLRGWNGRL